MALHFPKKSSRIRFHRVQISSRYSDAPSVGRSYLSSCFGLKPLPPRVVVCGEGVRAFIASFRALRRMIVLCRARGLSSRMAGLSHSGFSAVKKPVKPKASEVLTAYLKQTREPPWTSYFVRHTDVVNDQYGMSHFNWPVGRSNYTVLRVGCFPFIKYHCTRGPPRDLDTEDKFFRFIKVANLGIPCLMYGIAALFLIKHKEAVHLESGSIYIYFLIKENLGSQY